MIADMNMPQSIDAVHAEMIPATLRVTVRYGEGYNQTTTCINNASACNNTLSVGISVFVGQTVGRLQLGFSPYVPYSMNSNNVQWNFQVI